MALFRCFTVELLSSIFGHLDMEHTTATTVSLVCKKWYQAALRSPSMWAHRIHLSAYFPQLYQTILPRIGDDCEIRTLLLAMVSRTSGPLSWDPQGISVGRRIPIVDPYLSPKLTLTLPCLVHRVRNLKLEVPSNAWGLLEKVFTHDLSRLESLELSRVYVGTTPDFLAPSSYTSPSLEQAVRNATRSWSLRALCLYGCALKLTPPNALGNLEELRIFDLPAVAAFTPPEVLRFVERLPRLKLLHLSHVTTIAMGQVGWRKRSIEMGSLESFSFTGPVDHCAFIFDSLRLGPRCKVELIATNVFSWALVTEEPEANLVDYIKAIGRRQMENGGSATATSARIDLTKNICSLLASDSEGSTGSNIAWSFFLGLDLKPIPNQLSRLPLPHTLLYHMKQRTFDICNINTKGGLGGNLRSLHMNLEVGPHYDYRNQFDIMRRRFMAGGVRRVVLTCPGGAPYVWVAPLD